MLNDPMRAAREKEAAAVGDVPMHFASSEQLIHELSLRPNFHGCIVIESACLHDADEREDRFTTFASWSLDDHIKYSQAVAHHLLKSIIELYGGTPRDEKA